MISQPAIIYQTRYISDSFESDESTVVTLCADPDIARVETLSVVNLLQTAIVIEDLLELFTSEISSKLPINGLLFRSEKENLQLSYGRDGPHTCSYRLVVVREELGDLTLSSAAEFSPEVLSSIEMYLTALVYPLRNALLYRRALTHAFTDPVTGIHNRVAFNSTLHREVQLAQRHRHALSLIMVDADHFKRINDSYGHVVGDVVLRELAARMTGRVRSCDMTFRYGGEEFALLLSNTDLDGAGILAHSIRCRVAEEMFQCDGLSIPVTVSLGVGTLRPDDDAQSLVERSDKALYMAKRLGRNRVVKETELKAVP